MAGYSWIMESVESKSEILLIAVFSIVAIYMYIEALSFDGSSAIWPQILAVSVVVGLTLLVFQNQLPESLREVVAEGGSIIDEEDLAGEEPESQTDENGEQEEGTSTVQRPIHDSLFTVLSCTGYIGAGYLFGLLWMTPIFVAVYAAWFRLKWRTVVFLSALSFVIAFAFYELRNLSIESGIIFGGIL